MSNPNAINETTELWRSIHQEEQAKRAARKEANLAILRGTTIPFEYRNFGDVVLLRNKAYPAVDFYAGTNHWKVGGKNMMGDAHQLVLWLKRRAL